MVSAVDGVTPQTEFLFQALKKARVQIILFVNKIDQIGSDYKRVASEIREKLSNNVVVFSEISNENTRECKTRLKDCFQQSEKEYLWESIAACRDEWMEKFFEGTTPECNELESYIQETIRKESTY